tara:strand:+ start:447 stop:701 length:255 start_codon:yes stop_codon:yes gene_type:complete
MSTKAILCDDSDAWEAHNATASTGLGIPNASANCYAVPCEVTNPESSEVGKLVFPVKTFGTWKCDQFFDPDELVEWNPAWFDSE